MFLAGPGWVIFGAIKQIVGLFLAVYLIANVAGSAGIANQPVHQFLEIYQNFLPGWLAMTLAVVLVVISQIKINVTNAYSGSLAWTNSFTRVTKTYPGRLVFLGVNLLIALILMEANMFDFLNTILASTPTAVWPGSWWWPVTSCSTSTCSSCHRRCPSSGAACSTRSTRSVSARC